VVLVNNFAGLVFGQRFVVLKVFGCFVGNKGTIDGRFQIGVRKIVGDLVGVGQLLKGVLR